MARNADRYMNICGGSSGLHEPRFSSSASARANVHTGNAALQMKELDGGGSLQELTVPVAQRFVGDQIVGAPNTVGLRPARQQ